MRKSIQSATPPIEKIIFISYNLLRYTYVQKYVICFSSGHNVSINNILFFLSDPLFNNFGTRLYRNE